MEWDSAEGSERKAKSSQRSVGIDEEIREMVYCGDVVACDLARYEGRRGEVRRRCIDKVRFGEVETKVKKIGYDGFVEEVPCAVVEMGDADFERGEMVGSVQILDSYAGLEQFEFRRVR